MLKHLFSKKKVDIIKCCFNENCECKHLERIFINFGMNRLLFCKKCDKFIKHKDDCICDNYTAKEQKNV